MNPLQKLNALNKQSNTYQAQLLELMSSIAKESRGMEKLYEVITINHTLETRTFTFLLAQKANQPATEQLITLIGHFIDQNHNTITDQSTLINLNTAILRLLIHNTIDFTDKPLINNFASFVQHCLSQSDLVKYDVLELLRSIIEWEYQHYFLEKEELDSTLEEMKLIYTEKNDFLKELITDVLELFS